MKLRDDEEEEVSCNWIVLRKLEDTAARRRKQQIAQCGELALEEAVDLS
jgi:hypothetical protein